MFFKKILIKVFFIKLIFFNYAKDIFKYKTNNNYDITNWFFIFIVLIYFNLNKLANLFIKS